MDKDKHSARTPLSDLGLKKGSKLAYLFDFGDEWRLDLEVVDSWTAEEASYPMLVEAAGIPPPQYPPLDDQQDEEQSLALLRTLSKNTQRNE
jgi:hypothetical protein